VPSKRQFGTIRQLPSGRWQVRYRTTSGRRAPAPETFTTRRDASKWLAKAEAEQGRGWIDPSAGRVLLTDYAREWLQGQVTLAPRTKEIYEAQLRLYILPRIVNDVAPLGERTLDRITPELVRSWYASLVRTRSRSVAAKSYTRLRQILGQAVDDERIVRNPCRIDGGGVEHHPEQRTIGIKELYKLADAMPERYRALVLAAGLGGVREGELFALRRSDIELQSGVVRVHRKRLRLASGAVIEGQPKSRAGRRVVALPQPVVEEFRVHLTRYVAADLDAYVFTSALGKPLERSNFRFRVWAPAAAAVGLTGLKFHELRHTAGTLAAQTGATTKELMARLGHSSPRAAMIYQHASEKRDRRIADRLSEMVAEEGVPLVLPDDAGARLGHDDPVGPPNGTAGT
jgi:integrase